MSLGEIRVREAAIGYKRTTVLRNVDLTIVPGERVVVLGRSGAGKTTLLNTVYAGCAPDAALIPQSAALVQSLSVFHNVFMGRLDRHPTWYNVRTLGWPPRREVDAVRSVLEVVGLPEEIFVKAGQLSGGQQQRTSMARALFNARPIVIGDEPVSALDRHQAAALLGRLAERHPTQVLALHDVPLALAHASRILVIEGGRIALDAPASSLAPSDLVNTVAFAVLGVGFGSALGCGLALLFPRHGIVRVLCALLRSIHELFWALLLMQVLGLGPLTGVLAIGLPYAGIFAKVFAEMIEEADLSALQVLPPETSLISAFLYARLPDLWDRFGSYLLYRLECGLRSTLVLGFIGLPTIGFDLDSFFKEGDYAQAATLLLCFYALIATRRLWARPKTIPLLVLGSLVALPAGLAGGSVVDNLRRFLFHDIVPAPLRGADLGSLAPWLRFGAWLGDILWRQALPGALRTLVLSQMALVCMGALALLLFPVICRSFSGRWGRVAGRVLLVVVRSTPDYMLAYVLLQMLGPSMLPAVIALTLHNGAVVGYLMGRQADGLAYRPDAPRGADLYFYETLPRLYGQFLAYCLYRWEIILRESAVFGILGVTTLGFYVDAAISELHLDVALVLIVVTAALSLSVDALSRSLRAALRIEKMPVRLSAG